MKKQKIYKWIIISIALAINLFIIINSCFGGATSSTVSNSFVDVAVKVVNGISHDAVNKSNINSFTAVIRKLFGHFALFGLSGCMSTWAIYLIFKGTKYNFYFKFGLISFLFGLAVSWVTEFIQLFVNGRSGSSVDVAIDMLGYFIGVLLLIFILFLAKKPIFTKEKLEEKRAN